MKLRNFAQIHHADVLRIWQAASLPQYPLNARMLSYNLTPCIGEVVEGRVAVLNEKAVGFVFAHTFPEAPEDTTGWISALAVHPAARQQGIGAELLGWAEGWLQEKGCSLISLGGNLRPFMPGLPDGMPESLAFFKKHGYQSPEGYPYEYDIARSLKAYQALYPPPADTALRPMHEGEETRLLEFLRREFPGRWFFEAEEFIQNKGRASDFLLLLVADEVQGFIRLTLEDSERPIERFYPQRLAHPWGQLGPLGVSSTVRGLGLGGYLVDAAACHLKALGVDGCVIDWTTLVEFYEKFGFSEYNRYVTLFKSMPNSAG